MVDRKKLVWYDLDKNKVRKVRMRGIPVVCNSFVYTESLLKLTVDNPLQQHMPVQQKPSEDKQCLLYWVSRKYGSFNWFKGVMNEVSKLDQRELLRCTTV